MKNFLSILKVVNPMKAFEFVQKFGNHAKLIGDTVEYYKTEGVKRGVLKADAPEVKE